MKKIAIIIDGDLTTPKGRLNASLSRIKALKQIANYQIDIYAIQTFEGFLVRLLRRSNKRDRISTMIVDGLEIKLMWKNFSLLNYILIYRLKYKPILYYKWFNKYINWFKDYDIVSAHAIASGSLALILHEKLGLPYYVTWHGSDIHTDPFNNKYNKKRTIKVLENAENNFFVSKGLLECSDILTTKCKKTILYNGVGNLFKKYSVDRRIALRKQFDINDKKVVAFIGNLFPIKNVLLLPEIFERVSNEYKGDIKFWIIGDGKLRQTLKELLDSTHVDYQLWGNQTASLIPDFLNAIDVLVLPSKNESFGLVIVEALRCGANVVASNVGGIPEILTSDNIFDLNEHFTENISSRIVDMLSNSIEQPLSDVFSWEKTAEIEDKIYSEYLES